MTNLNIEQRLWEYIDGLSKAEERTAVETLIRTDGQWRDLYGALLQVHQALAAAEPEQPSLRFTKNVMEEIAIRHIAPATKKYINQKIIWSIAGFFILSIVGFLGYGFSQIDWTATAHADTTFGAGLSKIEYEKFFNSSVIKVFMMLNAVLGLMLLDRYLARRRGPLYPGGRT